MNKQQVKGVVKNFQVETNGLLLMVKMEISLFTKLPRQIKARQKNLPWKKPTQLGGILKIL